MEKTELDIMGKGGSKVRSLEKTEKQEILGENRSRNSGFP